MPHAPTVLKYRVFVRLLVSSGECFLDFSAGDGWFNLGRQLVDNRQAIRGCWFVPKFQFLVFLCLLSTVVAILKL